MEKSLKVIEQKEVTFYEDQVTAVRVKTGTIYVPIRPICKLLHVDFDAQRRRINRDIVLSEKVMSVVVTTTDMKEGDRRPRTSTVLALPLDFISGFLFGINAKRVKEEVRERLIRYQKECYQVLSEAFFEGRLTGTDDFQTLLESNSPTAQAYKTFHALTKLARQQLLLESRVNSHEERIERLESIIGDPKHWITPDQASQISEAVKTVAHAMGGQGEHYQAVYGQFYREFSVPSYKQLPQNRFEEAMKFLADWYIAVAGKEVPF